MRNASIKLALDETIAKVNADPIQLQQVLLNLITNGLDAMEGMKTEKKVLTISTSAKNSTSLLISIADVGAGISNDKLEEVFEPFHTSKSDGIGLGLAISKSIIESHGGKIWAENNASTGARFVVLLPGVK